MKSCFSGELTCWCLLRRWAATVRTCCRGRMWRAGRGWGSAEAVRNTTKNKVWKLTKTKKYIRVLIFDSHWVPENITEPYSIEYKGLNYWPPWRRRSSGFSQQTRCSMSLESPDDLGDVSPAAAGTVSWPHCRRSQACRGQKKSQTMSGN